MAKKVEVWIGRVTWMSRVNGQVKVDGGRMVWELERPSMEYAAEVWSTGGRTACRKLESSHIKMGRRLLGAGNTVAGVAVPGRSNVEEVGEKE